MRQDFATPMFTIVSAVYNVARYLPDFIDSIEGQTFPLDNVEVIMVDDGSTDDSLEIIREWQSRRPGLISVLQRPNGGQSAARNDGLNVATGAWVTFTDPDDVLDANYLSEVQGAISRWPAVSMIATPRILMREETGDVVDEHHLRKLFEQSNHVKDLDRFPSYFHGSAPASFVRRAELERFGLRFDERIRPNFEDGHLLQRYLLRCNKRTVAFVGTARYLYRKRADQSSTLQTGSLDERRFREVPRHGYLELLEEAVELAGGRPPAWLQSMIIYELSFFISPEDRSAGNTTACHGEVAEEFVSLLRQIRALLDDDVIDAFRTRRLRPEWHQVIRHGLVPDPWHSDVIMHRYDRAADSFLFSYRWTGPEPAMQLLHKGHVIEPTATKIRSWEYFDHVLMQERMVWAPASASFGLKLDGRLVPLQTEWPTQPVLALRPTALRRALGAEPPIAPPVRSREQRLKSWLTMKAANHRLVRRRYRDAWVLLDRVGQADDSAEVLFTHLRRHHPKINAWFVIDSGTVDGKRVKRLLGRRVVAYRSFRWLLLMLNARHLISSHADVSVIDPPEIRRLVDVPSWKVTFLQHGVTKSDIASWLNPKSIDLLVTSTPSEQGSIVGDHSRYRFTEKDVKLLGMPRFDDLQQRNVQRRDEPDLVLIAPTWRDWLNKPLAPGEVVREIVDDLDSTEWAQNWLGLLASADLASACRERGLSIGFLPHPNLQPALHDMSIPRHVEALAYGDVRSILSRTAVMVTDFSSIAFDTALLGRPAVYFQFDEQRVEQGGHMGKAGYYRYREHGYGPVTTSLHEAIASIISSLDSNGELQEPYRARAEKDFAHVRDGQCCERVVETIRSM